MFPGESLNFEMCQIWKGSCPAWITMVLWELKTCEASSPLCWGIKVSYAAVFYIYFMSSFSCNDVVGFHWGFCYWLLEPVVKFLVKLPLSPSSPSVYDVSRHAPNAGSPFCNRPLEGSQVPHWQIAIMWSLCEVFQLYLSCCCSIPMQPTVFNRVVLAEDQDHKVVLVGSPSCHTGWAK